MPSPQPFYRWRPHPWHGLEVGPDPPRVVNAYIELTPFDLVKYEIDKTTGYMLVDRPQRTSSQPPTLYGFIPRTYCGKRVHELSPRSEGGDADPLDICVISERPINRSEVILQARVVGGIQAVDGGEADDKIVATLENDRFWKTVEELADLPDVLVDRLTHYFSTYKMAPGGGTQMEIVGVYGRQRAMDVVRASIDDYNRIYGG